VFLHGKKRLNKKYWKGDAMREFWYTLKNLYWDVSGLWLCVTSSLNHFSFYIARSSKIEWFGDILGQYLVVKMCN
jgi:hypothetical protein